MRRILYASAIMALSFSSPAVAACYGGNGTYTCTDAKGNTYVTTTMGDTTYTSGTNADGKQWDKTSMQQGDKVVESGTGTDGKQWTNTTVKTSEPDDMNVFTTPDPSLATGTAAGGGE